MEFNYVEIPLQEYKNKVNEIDNVRTIVENTKNASPDALVALITGTYDLGHAEHKRFISSVKEFILKQSKESIVVLGLDSDEWVKKRKGPLRPILNFKQRSVDLSYLDDIDYIVEHNGDNTNLIEAIRPHIFIMSKATKEEQPIDRKTDFKAIGRIGGIVGILEGGGGLKLSTTKIIEKITEVYVKQPF